ncbi:MULTISPECIES: LysE family translocator [Acinetobacter]|jgi:threonine/homoserine/homoserine lactone efflux protein|uniref:LysE family translocator n=1 Tax=Acinetobacter chengduensis TaxID=2420890 RepID=A0ABX9TZB5_9GAMM|nr:MULTISPECIES: LysE family translocator [Acinetobacter]MBI1451112.1 LysE family translocator [Acinetobacter sp. FL51]RKG43584.1 LysE family translocator [Acinetobacter sp. WCHAc060007]RLL24013.1 LysE family translocator [Acinetobacter chengduensis]
MNYSEYFLYCVAVIVMIATPGPVMLLVASAGLKGGYKKALQTIFGTNLASLVLIVLSVLILKGVLNINEQWLNAIKILGCIYIAYIGLQVLKEAREAQPEQNQVALSDTQGGFKQGLLVGISNPKDIIFFASFFPQFTGITADLNLSLSILTISWIILDFATLSLVYLAFNRLSGSAVYPKLLGICGAVLVVVALYGIYSALF